MPFYSAMTMSSKAPAAVCIKLSVATLLALGYLGPAYQTHQIMSINKICSNLCNRSRLVGVISEVKHVKTLDPMEGMLVRVITSLHSRPGLVAGMRSLRSRSLRWAASTAWLGLLLATSGFVPVSVPNGHPLDLSVSNTNAPVLLASVGHTIVVERWGESGWVSQPVTKTAADAAVISGSLVSQPKRMFAAVVLGESDSARIQVFMEPKGATTWTSVLSTTIPTLVAGSIQLAVAGHYDWVLAEGTPGAGLMAKELWMSVNAGKSWQLFATGDVTAASAPHRLPTGYPTGIAATASGRLILSNSPRGDGTTDVAEYRAGASIVRHWTFERPGATVDEALPALVRATRIIVPIIESGKSVTQLAEAVRSTTAKSWSIHALDVPDPGPAEVVLGVDAEAEAMVEAHSLQIVSVRRPVRQVALLSSFPQPLMAVMIGPDSVVALKSNHTLWVNTAQGTWKPWQ